MVIERVKVSLQWVLVGLKMRKLNKEEKQGMLLSFILFTF